MLNMWNGFNLLSDNFVFNADDDVPSKTAKIDIPSSPFLGGMVPPHMGTGYPPRSTLGTLPPVYAC